MSLRFPCASAKELIDIFSEMYLPTKNIRHWIILTEENPSAAILPNVSTPGLNKFLLENLSKSDRKAIEKFANENQIQIIECLKFDIRKKILNCKDVEGMLKLFQAMYPSKINVRHWAVIAEKDRRVVLQPSVSTGLDTFCQEDLSEEDLTKIKEFAEAHQIKIIECSTFEFDE